MIVDLQQYEIRTTDAWSMIAIVTIFPLTETFYLTKC